MLDLHCIQTLSHEELQWESMESAVGAQCLSSLAEQKSCQLAYVLFLLPYFLSPAAFQGIRMWLLGIEEKWALGCCFGVYFGAGDGASRALPL